MERRIQRKLYGPKTYRGLQIGYFLAKVIVFIIINHLKSGYENQLLDQQQGFRTGRGTPDGIFTTKYIHQITVLHGRQMIF